MCIAGSCLRRLAGAVGPIRGDQKISRYNPAILFDGRQVEGETELGDAVLSPKLLTEGGKAGRREREREAGRESLVASRGLICISLVFFFPRFLFYTPALSSCPLWLSLLDANYSC